MFNKTYKISLLDSKWEVVKENVEVAHIPRTNELIYLPEHDKYFRVINVVYNFTTKQEIFIIIEEHN